MVTFPNAKINLGLNILSKREDGYHNINSCFYPIPFSDILEIVQSEVFEFKSTGLTIPGEGNLCVRAFEILQKDHGIRNVKIHLYKVIPIGAGLGGGSADATFTLLMLNDIFELGLSESTLESYAAQLGSDCPFFVKNQPVMARGTGTELEAFDINLKSKFLALLSPDIHVSTAEAYSGVTPKVPDLDISQIITKPLSSWRNALSNNFEMSVFPNHPEIAQIKNQLYDLGASYASMTGSGSAVYGLFEYEPDLSPLKQHICWSGFLN